MWHLYSCIDETSTVLRATTWASLQQRIIEQADQLGKSIKQTVQMLARDATPDKPWMCVSDNFVFKLRELHEHAPVLEATDE